MSEDENIEKLVEQKNIKTILISSNPVPEEKIIRSALNMKFKGITVYDAATFYKHLTGKVPIFHIKELWLLLSAGMGVFGHPYYRRAKPMIDVLLSSIFLSVASPILVLCAIAIKLESKGPLFFRQERVGLNQKPFTLLKLRTMQENAEGKTGPVREKKMIRVSQK